jgi:UDP-3-O-[3-hydroxymyristoyl] N-acetylglucosamine deacetylase
MLVGQVAALVSRHSPNSAGVFARRSIARDMSLSGYCDCSMIRRKTLRQRVGLSGVGIHSGQVGVVEVGPADYGSGLRIFHNQGETFPVHIDYSMARPGASILRHKECSVLTPEHLLAAMAGCGITDAEIRVRGEEVPILDGSAAPWVEEFERVGFKEGPRVDPFEIKVERAVHFADASAYLAPADRLKLSVSIDFVDGPKGSFAAEIPRDFDQVANARTFVVMPDRDDLKAQGRGLGISPENTVTFVNSLPVNPTRYPDEAIRHKVLDLLGDLALLGQPIVGHIHVDRGTHSVHQELVRDLLTSG